MLMKEVSSAEPPTHAFSIGRKVTLAFLAIAVALVTLGVVAIYNLRAVQLAADRLTEETREAQVIQELVVHLQDSGRDAAKAVAQTKAAIAALSDLGEEEDPSDFKHTRAEQHLYVAVSGHLDNAEAAIRRGTPAEADTHLDRILGIALTLYAETKREFNRSHRDLERRSGYVLRALVVTSLLVAVILMLSYVFVARQIVRPLKEMRRGATLLGGGYLGHRIHVHSKDELGDLAAEFNRMAQRLASHHAELELQVRERTRQFVRAAKLAEMGELAAGVAHEINNPLASIASCAEVLERRLADQELDQDEAREYLTIIAKEAYRMQDTTSRLLLFARQEPGTLEDTDVEQLLGELIRIESPAAKKRGLLLDVEIERPLPRILANPGELKQVLINLLKNAYDASTEGDTVHVRAQRGSDGLTIQVVDHGQGVKPENLDRIFDPFYTTKSPGKGTGLGLALAYRIIEGHGGLISVQGTRDGGACFTVHLPVPQESAL